MTVIYSNRSITIIIGSKSGTKYTHFKMKILLKNRANIFSRTVKKNDRNEHILLIESEVQEM